MRERHAETAPHLELVVDGARAMEASMCLTAVRRHVDALPAEQRAVLLLVCVEGLSYREAAETLGIPAGTVMSRLARARAALTARMDIAPRDDPERRAMDYAKANPESDRRPSGTIRAPCKWKRCILQLVATSCG